MELRNYSNIIITNYYIPINLTNLLQFKALGTNIIKKIAFPGKGEKMVRDYDSRNLESQNYSNIIITKYYIPINLTNKD